LIGLEAYSVEKYSAIYFSLTVSVRDRLEIPFFCSFKAYAKSVVVSLLKASISAA